MTCVLHLKQKEKQAIPYLIGTILKVWKTSCVWVVFASRIQIAEYLSALRLVTAFRLLYTLQAAKEIEKSEYKHLEPEKKWVQRLFQPGSSMGGARPKACVQSDGHLYLAKFPSINDDINMSRWEHFAHLLAKECGINVAETQIIRAGNGQDILLSKRFDRTEDNKRIHMASSLTVLGFTDCDGQRTGKGYLDIVDFIISRGGNHIEANLEDYTSELPSISVLVIQTITLEIIRSCLEGRVGKYLLHTI